MKQDRGVTILIFRGTDNAKNIGTDIDLRPAHDKSLDVENAKSYDQYSFLEVCKDMGIAKDIKR